MAAGDQFTQLLNADDPTYQPPDDVAPAGSQGGDGSLSDYISAGKQVSKVSGEKGFGGFDRPQQAQELIRSGEEAQALLSADSSRHARDEQQRASINAGVAGERQDDQMRAEYGTTDPLKAAQLKATGVLDADFPERFKADPQGSAAAAAKAFAILGRGGMQDAPSGPPAPGRTYSVGVGTHGEPYYTNKTEGELASEGAPVQGIGPGPTPSGALTPLNMQDSPTPVSGTESKDPADVLFQGKLDKVQQVLGQPARTAQVLKDTQDFQTKMLALGHEQGADVARQAVTDSLGKDNIPIKAKQDIDKVLTHFGQYTAKQIKDKHLDPMQYFPYHKTPPAPGTGDDLTQQASVTNPGGRMGDTQFQAQRQQQVAAGTTQQIDEQAGEEQPSAMHYAISDTAKRLKRSAAKEALAKANLPSNPLMGRLESDRQQEITDATQRLVDSQ